MSGGLERRVLLKKSLDLDEGSLESARASLSGLSSLTYDGLPSHVPNLQEPGGAPRMK
jgi:hypothetical protein